jgi:tRNA pseudouridine55 synthase
VRLGQATETYDSEGEPVGEFRQPPEMDATAWQELLKQFTGEIQQTPPLYSAKRVKGKRLYEYAREGKQVTPKPQTVTIYSIDIKSFDRERLELEISCGSGMYVRSLADDIGRELGCGAYLEGLIRTKAGPFAIEESFSIADVEEMIGSEDFSFFRPPAGLLPGMAAITANPGQRKRFVNGNFIVAHNPLYKHRQEIRVLDEDGTLLGIGEVEKPLGSEMVNIHPRVVIQ